VNQFLDREASTLLFGADSYHPPVRVSRIKGARIIWLNDDAMRADPTFTILGSDRSRYARHIVDSCGFEIVDAEAGASRHDLTIAYADRYGGNGIGHNGGSGRSAYLNGYHVKGIGRTPLLSCLASPAHASGTSSLAASMREAIYSRIVAARFPHSAVPTLAIIDADMEDQRLSGKPPSERRALLVRPAFIRPAHFERAVAFVCDNPYEGVIDHARVQSFFRCAVELFGRDGVSDMYRQFWVRWAEQLAYGFAHRMPHGSNTTSNIAIDGRLVDFGSMSAVPSWANIATMIQHQPFSALLGILERALRSISYYFSRHFDSTLSSENAIAHSMDAARNAFRRGMAKQTLALLGIDDAPEHSGIQQAVWPLVKNLVAHYQASVSNLEQATMLGNAWDLPSVWLPSAPSHLQPLRQLLLDFVPPQSRDRSHTKSLELSDEGEGLQREGLRQRIKAFLDSQVDTIDTDAVHGFIRQHTPDHQWHDPLADT
jgi:hypothetical protein